MTLIAYITATTNVQSYFLYSRYHLREYDIWLDAYEMPDSFCSKGKDGVPIVYTIILMDRRWLSRATIQTMRPPYLIAQVRDAVEAASGTWED